MKKLCIAGVILLLVLMLISALIALSEKSPLKDKVALIRIEGPIMESKEAIEELKKYAKEPSVKAIVLRVDSPGGAVAPSQEIYEEVKKAAASKPVVASMGSVSASGGYYIVSPATKVIANPGTITGSIGVIMEIPNIEGLMGKIGVKTEVIKSGKHKDMATVFRTMGKEEREILQAVLDDVHSQFINAVAEGRKLPVETVRELADGRIFTGRHAAELRLVDELGNIEDAIALAARLAGIKGEPEVVSKETKFTVIDLLRGKLPGQFMEVIPSMKVKYMMTP